MWPRVLWPSEVLKPCRRHRHHKNKCGQGCNGPEAWKPTHGHMVNLLQEALPHLPSLRNHGSTTRPEAGNCLALEIIRIGQGWTCIRHLPANLEKQTEKAKSWPKPKNLKKHSVLQKETERKKSRPKTKNLILLSAPPKPVEEIMGLIQVLKQPLAKYSNTTRINVAKGAVAE